MKSASLTSEKESAQHQGHLQSEQGRAGSMGGVRKLQQVAPWRNG